MAMKYLIQFADIFLCFSYTILTTVPIETNLNTSSTSLLYIWIHPFETSFPIELGLLVPWIP